MNYLFHLYLSGNDPEITTGNFMGDFVKGRIPESYPPRLRNGLELHRSIDSFAHTDPTFNRSRLRIDDSFGLYRGILVDLYYDHFLASAWGEYSTEPLPVYLRRVRIIVQQRARWMPERLQGLLPIIFEDMIPSYLDPEGIALALNRMSRRVKRENPLSGGGVELKRHYRELREDFREFLPAAQRHAQKFLDAVISPTG